MHKQKKILKTSKRDSNLVETDERKDVVIIVFIHFLELIKIKHNSRYSSKIAVFPEGFDGILRNLQKKPVFKDIMLTG